MNLIILYVLYNTYLPKMLKVYKRQKAEEKEVGDRSQNQLSFSFFLKAAETVS